MGVSEDKRRERRVFTSLKEDEYSRMDDFVLVYEYRDILRRGREIAKHTPKREFTLKLFDSLMKSVVRFGKINFEYVSEECLISQSYARVCTKFLLKGIKRRLYYG
jgi:hypothetical protein